MTPRETETPRYTLDFGKNMFTMQKAEWRKKHTVETICMLLLTSLRGLFLKEQEAQMNQTKHVTFIVWLYHYCNLLFFDAIVCVYDRMHALIIIVAKSCLFLARAKFVFCNPPPLRGTNGNG